MHVDESGDLQQLKRTKTRYLYLSLPGCPSPSAVGIFRPPPLSFLPLQGRLQLQQVVEVVVEEGEVEEGEVQERELEVEEGDHSVGGWEAL